MFPFDEIAEAVGKAMEIVGDTTGLSTVSNTPTLNMAAFGPRDDAYGIWAPLVAHRPELVAALGASFRHPDALGPALDALAPSVRGAIRLALRNGLPPAADPGDGLGPVPGEQQVADEIARMRLGFGFAAVTGRVPTWADKRTVWTSADEDASTYAPEKARWGQTVAVLTGPWFAAQVEQALAHEPPPPPPPPPPAKDARQWYNLPRVPGTARLRWADVERVRRFERSRCARVLPPALCPEDG